MFFLFIYFLFSKIKWFGIKSNKRFGNYKLEPKSKYDISYLHGPGIEQWSSDLHLKPFTSLCAAGKQFTQSKVLNISENNRVYSICYW